MIASRVTSQKEFSKHLKGAGFERTKTKTSTGTFWKHGKTGLHILVPKSVQGFYPTWLTADIQAQIDNLTAWEKIDPPV